MRKLFGKAFACALVALTALQAPAQAATYYYYRGGAQAGQQTGSPPASPAAPGVFAILVDGPEPDVAIKGQSYSATTYAYSNVGQVVFAVQAGSLPAGLSINSTTGTISGMPTTVGSASFVIQGVDTASGRVATDSRTLDTVDAFSITAAPATSVIAGNAYSATFALAGGGQPYSFTATGLPPGLSISSGAATGTVAGTSAAIGSYSVAVTGTEAHGLAVSYPYTLNVVAPLAIVGLPPGTGTVGIPYSGQVQVSGGLAPYSYSVSAGTLPNNVSLKPATGVVSGTPTAAGTKSGIRIKVTDASGQSVTSNAFSIVVGASGNQSLSINASPVATATESQIYSSQWFAGGGTTPYVYSLAPGSGPLPAGLTLNGPTGIVSGSPTLGSTGTYPNIIVQVRDALGAVAVSAPYALTVLPNHPLAISGNPGNGQVAIPYAYQFNAIGGSEAGYVYALGTGTLPAGLVVQQNGLLTGVPTTAGTYSFKVRVTDSASATALTSTMTIIVSPTPPLVISGNPPTNATIGQAYLATWTAFDGSGSGYHFASVGGPLPPGLTLSDVNGAQATLSGSPTISGTFPGLQIKVTDSLGQTATSNVFSITVAAPALLVSGNPPSAASVGQPYSTQFSATGGSGSGYVWSLAGGTLPAGLTLSSTGAISGIPAAAGTYSGIVVRVADGTGGSALSSAFSIAVSDGNPITAYWNPPTEWIAGAPFRASGRASGGTPANYVWSHSGPLPDGVTQDPSTGALSGTPNQTGTYGPVRLSVTDGTNTATTAAVTFTVTTALTISAVAPSGPLNVGDWWDSSTVASGGDPSSYRFSYEGQLPPGFLLYGGDIRGNAGGTGGTYGPVVITVTDGIQTASTDPITIVVGAPAPLSASWSPSTNWTAGSRVSVTATASGGNASACSWSASGPLPPGVELVPWGGTVFIDGTPTTAGTYGPVVLTCSDGSQTASTSPAIFTVFPSSTPVSVSWFPSGQWTVGDLLYAWANPSGGDPSAYSWSLSGTLPPGVTLQNAAANGNSTSLAEGLVGTLTAGGTYGPITLTVSDGVTSATTRPVTFTVLWPALAATGNLDPNAQESAPYSGGFAAAGGNGVYTWSVAQGMLPSGLALDPANGLISGVPTAGSAGTYAGIVVRAADTIGNVAYSAPFALVVRPAPTALSISANAPSAAVVGTPYGAEFSVSGGTGPYGIVIEGAPSGLSIQPSTSYATLSGTIAAVGSYPITVTATDSAGASTSYAYSLKIGPAVTVAGNPPATGQVDVPYSAQFTASGGNGGPYTFFIDMAALALDQNFQGLPGATIDPTTGVLTFTPPDIHQAASYDIAVNAVDSAGLVGTALLFTVNVDWTPPPLAVAGDPNPNATVGAPYFDPGFSASGGYGGPYTYYVDWNGPQLPDGITLDPYNGTLSGTPFMGDHAGAYGPIVVNAFDVNFNRVQSAPFTINLATYVPSGPLLILGKADDGYRNQAYTATFSAGGGDGPTYVYSLAAGSGPLPPGLSLSNQPSYGTAAISGWPTALGSYPGIVIEVVDGTGAHVADTPPFTIAIADPPLAIDGQPPTTWQTSSPYSAQFSASGGTGGPYVFSAATPLPTGFSIDPDTGVLSCNCSTPGVYPNIAIQVTDGTTTAQYPAFLVTVTGDCAVSAVMGPLQMHVGQRYAASFSAFNGAPVQTTYQVWGRVPAGLTFNPVSGTLSGTLAAPGSYAFQVVATACGGISAAYKLDVSGPLALSGVPDTDVVSGFYYASTNPVASGGAGGNTFSVVSGALPPGLGVGSNGTVRGTPDPSGIGQTYAGIVIQVQDSNGATAMTAPFSMTVHARRNPGGPLQIEMLPDEPIVVTVDEELPPIVAEASGGSGKYTYRLVPAVTRIHPQAQPRILNVQDADVLPPGASFYAGEATARVSGRPSAEGLFLFSVEATDEETGEIVESEAAIIHVRTFSIDMANQQLETGKRADIPSSVKGGTGPFTYKPGGGMLPPGLTLSLTTGRLSGIPTAGGQYIFSIVVTDSSGTSEESSPITIEVDTVSRAECPVFTSGYFGPSGVVNKSIRYRAFTANGPEPSIEATGGTQVLGLEFEHVPFDDFVQFFRANATQPGVYAPIVVDAWNSECSNEVNPLPMELVTPLSIDVPVQAPDASTGVAYRGPPISASGGKSDTYRFSAIGLPPGLKMNPATGLITGKPAPGYGDVVGGKEYSIYVQVMDGYGYHTMDVMSLILF